MTAPGLSLQEMRDLARTGLGGLDIDELPDEECDQLLNLSYWDLESRFPFVEKDFRTETDVIQGSGQIDLDGFVVADVDAIQSLAVIQPDSMMSIPLQRMTQSYYDRIFDERTDTQAQPEFYLRQDRKILLWPIPEQTYTIRFYFLKTLKSLLAGTIDTPNFPRTWHEIVVEGAISRGHFYQQDYNLQQQAGDSQISKIRTAIPTANKEERDPFAGLIVQHDDPGTGVVDPDIASDDPYYGRRRW